MGLIDDARNATRGALCSMLNGLEAIDRWGVNLGLPEDAPPSFPGTPFGNIVNNGQGIFCDRMPMPRPTPLVFGQCPVAYTVNFQYRATNTSTGFTTIAYSSNGGIIGPIRGIRIANPASPGRIVIDGGAGAQTVLEQSSATVLSEPAFNTFKRNDNQPDNCPPPAITPLPEADRTRPVTINNINGAVVFAFPTLNVNGDLQVGFNLNVGELKLSGTVELNTGDITFNFGGQPSDPDAPQVPTPDATPPAGEDDSPEPEKKANIIGVIVVSQESGNAPATELTFPNSPNVLIPRTATVQFKIRIKNKSHWTSEIPVRSKNAYIHCPAEVDAIAVVVTSDPGWVVSSTPVRGIVPSNQIQLL